MKEFLDKYKIRPLKESDLSEVFNITESNSFTKTHHIDIFKNHFGRDLICPKSRVFGNDKTILGVALCGDRDYVEGLYLSCIAVNPYVRGLGIARQMINYLQDLTDCLLLHVDQSNHEAIRLYINTGFKCVRVIGLDSYLLQWRKINSV